MLKKLKNKQFKWKNCRKNQRKAEVGPQVMGRQSPQTCETSFYLKNRRLMVLMDSSTNRDIMQVFIRKTICFQT